MFDQLWKKYVSMNPAAEIIKSQFEKHGETVFNDHIAIRTFNNAQINIDQVAKAFLEIGYICKEEYSFPGKHLNAKHYAHASDESMPKVFISEIQIEHFSTEIQDLIKTDVYDKISIEPDLPLVLSSDIWGKPSHKTYNKLSDTSEYLGWLYAHGICVNHFTVDTNKLSSFNSLEEVNQFVRKNGHTLNLSGGEIKGSKDVFLEQSSTISETYLHEFIEGKFMIPSSFYEFSRRYVNPSNNEFFQGFIASSANKIFESTDRQKIA